MGKTSSAVRFAAFAIALAAAASVAQAQATRTWVSGVGDDANPCSRTAPCKTFAGAISKTATGGEINVLDPGGFGGVTITKSITISSESFEAGVLVSGTNAIVINAPTTANVVLRGLDIEGLGTGLTGIKVLAAGSVHVENCTINNFTQFGIDFVPTAGVAAASRLVVSDTIVRNNNGASSGGIRIKPGANVTVNAMILRTTIANNFQGLRVESHTAGALPVSVVARDVVSTDNATAGFIAVSNNSILTELTLDSCVASNNVNGVKADNANAIVTFGHSTFAGNTTAGIQTSGGGQLRTFTGTNTNGDGGVANGSVAPQ